MADTQAPAPLPHVPARPPLRRGRLIVDVVNDGPIEPVLADLRLALMRTGHGPRIHIHGG